jgi:predicted NBD/HSP70 family sugar kinase
MGKLKTDLPKLIDHCCVDFKLERSQLLGLGLGISGIVDIQSGQIIKSLQFEMRDYPLAKMLTDELHLPVHLDHDANLIALAEQQQGNARGLRDFVVLILDDEIRGKKVHFRSFGSALVLNGKVHRGHQYAAGEIDKQLLPQITSDGKLSDLDVLADVQAPLSAWLEHVAEQVGVKLGALVNLLDPEAILLAGDRPIVNEAFVQQIAEVANNQRIGDLPNPVEVVTCAFSTQSCARGAALATRDKVLAYAVANHIR